MATSYEQILTITSTSALFSKRRQDAAQLLVKDVGIFNWEATGPANGVSTFTAADGGFWVKKGSMDTPEIGLVNGPTTSGLEPLGYGVDSSTFGIKSIAVLPGSGVTVNKTVLGDSLTFTISGEAGSVVDTDLTLVNALGAGFVAMTLPMHQVNSTRTLSDGEFRLVAFYLPQTTTITGVKWLQAAQGTYVGDNYNGIALYSYFNGNLTLRASTANDGNIWAIPTGSAGSKAFTAAYSAAPGVYYIGCLFNSSSTTTAPAISAGSSVQTPLSHAFFTNGAKLSAADTGVLSLPSSFAMSTISNSSGLPWFALY